MIFLKHIWRAIRRAPLQPLLILFTITLAVAISIVAFRAPELYTNHAKKAIGTDSDLGDLIVTTRGNSDTRFLFTKEIESLLGEDGTALGEFRLTGFFKYQNQTELLSISAVDFLEADAYYLFHYLEYGEFTTQNLTRSAILSSDAAQDYNLSLGDRFTVRILETDFTYTVQAIAKEEGLLKDCDVLIPIEGLMQVLASKVPSLAALGSEFIPYTRLFIQLTDQNMADTVLNRLSNEEALANMLIKKTDASNEMAFLISTHTVSLCIPALLLLILCWLLIGTSLKLLRLQRSSEYALFCTCGASRRKLAQLQITESLIYALVGGALGILLSQPLLNGLSRLYSWESFALKTECSGIILGMIVAPCFMLACTLLHLSQIKQLSLAQWLQQSDSTGDAGSTNNPKHRTILPLCLTVLCLTVLLCVPVAYRYIFAIGLLICLVWLLYCIVPPLLQLLFGIAERITERFDRPNTLLLFANKNIKNAFPLRHLARLWAILFAILFTTITCHGVLQEQSDLMLNTFTAEYAALNPDSNTEALLRDDQRVAAVSRLTTLTDVQLPNGNTAIGISMTGDVANCIQQNFLPQKLPTANETVISVGIATLAGVKVGDEITLTFSGIPYTFTIIEIMNINMHYVYFDAQTVGIAPTALCFKMTEEAKNAPDSQEYFTSLLEANGSACIPTHKIFSTLPHSINSYLSLLRYAVVAAVGMTLIGTANVFIEQFHARRSERAILHISGMTRGKLIGLYVVEVLLVALVAILIALLVSYVFCYLIDFGVRSFGMALFP